MILEVVIDALAQGGQGVGRHDGKAIFVPFSAPGDRLRCRVLRDRGRFAEAEAVEWLDAGAGRRSPPCPVFGDCGGCQWQHLEYALQAGWKQRLYADHLRRGAQLAGAKPVEILAAPEEWGYRSRAQFKCRQTQGGFVMGFYRRGSRLVVDVAHCAVAAGPVNRALTAFRAWLPASPCPARLPQVDIECGADGRTRAVVHCLDRRPDRLARYLQPLAAAEDLALFIQTGRKGTLRPVCGREALEIAVDRPPLTLGYGAGGFAQVNLDQNRNLVAEVVGAVDWTGSETVLDLFCGMGNLSLPLARRARRVVGVENYGPSIARARRNARRHGLDNAVFHVGEAAGAAARYLAGTVPDLVVLDPPRQGAYRLCRELQHLQPRRILYVSCDPATLARDLLPLLRGGYRLVRSRALDFFPQTSHIESVSLLERTG